MKLQVSYNCSNLAQALTIAEQTADYADILGVGSLLLFKEGIRAVKTFKATFPNKDIAVEARITEKADIAIKMMASEGARYITVLAGSYSTTITKAVAAAQESDTKIVLDLLDAQSLGQSALDAKTLGIHSLILYRHNHTSEFTELDAEWHSVRENTQLPIFIAGKIDETNIQHIIALKPHGIIIGTHIMKADNPAKAAQYFKSLM